MECGPGQEEQDENVEIGISDREREDRNAQSDGR